MFSAEEQEKILSCARCLQPYVPQMAVRRYVLREAVVSFLIPVISCVAVNLIGGYLRGIKAAAKRQPRSCGPGAIVMPIFDVSVIAGNKNSGGVRLFHIFNERLRGFDERFLRCHL